MKKYLIKWRIEDNDELDAFMIAENWKVVIKNVSYLEKKTGCEVISIQIVKEDEN